ncbi:MAG: flagellar biosynthetic protein FliO [Gammaproteobacteria bacterium]|nr:flagellar biosynthetic protein FliO [Gammaproteobacteria bacterium]MDJ0890342.1 flagellar biosynthetic protein FliO [Gammaproteobacteria bacterium]
MMPTALRLLALPATVSPIPAFGAGESVTASAPMVGAGSVLQMFLGLLAVLILIGALAWMLRHILRLQPTMSGQLRILGGLSMGARERVVLLKVGDTQLLLGVAPGRVHTLHVLDKPLAEQATESQLPKGFAAQLARALQRDKGALRDG